MILFLHSFYITILKSNELNQQYNWSTLKDKANILYTSNSASLSHFSWHYDIRIHNNNKK